MRQEKSGALKARTLAHHYSTARSMHALFLLLQCRLQALEESLILLTSSLEALQRGHLYLHDAPSRKALHYLVRLIMRVGVQDERSTPSPGRDTPTDLPFRLQLSQSFLGREDHAP